MKRDASLPCISRYNSFLDGAREPEANSLPQVGRSGLLRHLYDVMRMPYIMRHHITADTFVEYCTIFIVSCG
jgi:hypothetical protein